jgi:hypothetical protein
LSRAANLASAICRPEIRVRQRGIHLTADALAASTLAAAAAPMIAGSVLDAVRLPLAPWPLLVAAAAGGWTMFRAVRRSSPVVEGNRRWFELAIFLSIAGAMFGYMLWLASPSLLPVARGPDIVHHLSLVHTIQRTHRLPHGSAAEAYLGEMVHYTPGSHVLAAAVAMWLRVDALRVIYPVMAGAVALKCALLFLVTLRVLPESRSPLHAIAAPLLLMVPAEYFFGSVLRFGFYAQVVSEAFAAGMLLAAVTWARNQRRIWLAVFAVCGCATVLAWPVWVPPAMLALLFLLVRQRPAAGDLRVDVLTAAGPILLVGVVHLATHTGGASILGSAGTVTIPSTQTLGAGFIALALAGAVIAPAGTGTRVLVAFAAAIVVQGIALAALNHWAGSDSRYLPYKMVYLLVVAGAVLGACGLARLAEYVPGGRPGLAAVSAIAPLAIAVPLMWGRIPHKRQQSPITESSYAAGVWARDHLPVACIDYFSHDWLTGYWLHVDLLGNPRVSPRMSEETFEFRETTAKWIERRGQPYAIVDDLSSIPREVRPWMDVLYRIGPAAVVRRAGVSCRDQTMSIQEFEARAR